MVAPTLGVVSRISSVSVASAHPHDVPGVEEKDGTKDGLARVRAMEEVLRS